MREMHKWKDKVELSLDNRQIFFLFFGLSTLGCLVFALGVLVGRRLDFEPIGEVRSDPQDALALLEEPELEPTTYAQGLAAKGPQDGVLAAGLAGREPADAAEPAQPVAGGKAAPELKAAPHHGEAAVKAVKAPKDAKPAFDTVLAAAREESDGSGRMFTLQMKAFPKAEEAEAFAAPLRANGHHVRIEANEANGRIWHRVRLGEFPTWEEGLAAKTEFEKREKIIAYVVRL